jgi:hypothetical protein
MKLAHSNSDETTKALDVAHTTLKALIAMGSSTFNPGEQDEYEAVMTVSKTTSIEETRARDAVADAISDS